MPQSRPATKRFPARALRAGMRRTGRGPFDQLRASEAGTEEGVPPVRTTQVSKPVP